jgi:hypothetical protein
MSSTIPAREKTPELKDPYDDPKGLTEEERAILTEGVAEQEEKVAEMLAGKDLKFDDQLKSILALRRQRAEAETPGDTGKPLSPLPLSFSSGIKESPAAFQGLDEKSERVRQGQQHQSWFGAKGARGDLIPPKAPTMVVSKKGKAEVILHGDPVAPPVPARKPRLFLPTDIAGSEDKRIPESEKVLDPLEMITEEQWEQEKLAKASKGKEKAVGEDWPQKPEDSSLVRKALQAPVSRHSPASVSTEVTGLTREGEIAQLHLLIKGLKEENLVHREQNSEFAIQLKNLNGQFNQMSLQVAQILEQLGGKTQPSKITAMVERESIVAATTDTALASTSTTVTPPVAQPAVTKVRASFKRRK